MRKTVKNTNQTDTNQANAYQTNAYQANTDQVNADPNRAGQKRANHKRANLLVILSFTLMLMISMAMNTFAASISRKSMTITQGKTATLKVKGAKKVTWKSSKKKVATVSKKGKVKGVGAGTAVITAKAGKKKFTCKVTVLDRNTSGSVSAAAKSEKINTSTAGMNQQEAQVFRTLLGFRKSYPEGKHWTNKDYYAWNGGIYRGGYGCAAFAFLLSDAAFGGAKARIHKEAGQIRPGDILRVENNTHSVIVLRRQGKNLVVAEGNYNSSIHWGRKISAKELAATLDYVVTRYEA